MPVYKKMVRYSNMEAFPIQRLDPELIPRLFPDIPHQPKQIYFRGKLPPVGTTYLTVIGGRKCTPYGREVCHHLIKGLRSYPVAIVSGLAFGTDTYAHEAALEAGLPIIVFPGSGLGESVIYPRTNFPLAKRILESGGCIMSEYGETQAATMWTFPQRNRLMAGIARAVLIIEAENKSGARITTKLATDYNRDVLAVPGSIFSNMSEGTNQLLREGAVPILSVDNLLEAIDMKREESSRAETLFPTCSPEEQKILHLLASPMPRGDLIRALDIPTHKAQILISAMEIKGLVKEMMGMIGRN